MRTWMLAAVTLLAVGLIDARPASAAWTCVGAEYVCGAAPTASASRRSSSYLGEEKPAKAHRKAKASHTATASASWGDETAAPTRKGKRHQRQARSYDSDSGSSWGGGGSHYQSGVASYYWQPQRVASGGWFNPSAMTAAHKTLPFGTKVRVTNKRNGQSVVVTINDRGPYVAGRVIDLSSAAAGAISMKGAGVAPVAIAVLGR